jgi:proteasome beta subunit
MLGEFKPKGVPFFLHDGGSSFYDLLRQHHPECLPSALSPPSGDPRGSASGGWEALPRGTTILALRYRDGVVIGGDRRATEGFQIADRRIEKVFKADQHSAIAIAGVAGVCLETARLFQTELEHYEKIEGTVLTTEGKANKLAQMIRGNFPMAMQGLVVIPIFAAYDAQRQEGRIFKYDVTGGHYEEAEYHATGSGGRDARNTLKKLYRRALSEEEALGAALEALYDAAEEDVGTAGPDPVRGIYPTLKLVTARGIADVADPRVESLYSTLIARKRKE